MMYSAVSECLEDGNVSDAARGVTLPIYSAC